MSRTLNAATLARLEADSASIVYFFELTLDSSTERLWTGPADITALGETWVGAGSLAMIDKADSGLEVSPYGLQVGLSGVDATVLDIVFAATDEYYMRPCRLLVGAMADGVAGGLAADPDVWFRGFAQKMEMTIGEEGGDMVLLTCESEQIKFNRPRNRRYSDEQLQFDHTGDLGLQYLDRVPGSSVLWGTEKVIAPVPTVAPADNDGFTEGH